MTDLDYYENLPADLMQIINNDDLPDFTRQWARHVRETVYGILGHRRFEKLQDELFLISTEYAVSYWKGEIDRTSKRMEAEAIESGNVLNYVS